MVLHNYYLLNLCDMCVCMGACVVGLHLSHMWILITNVVIGRFVDFMSCLQFLIFIIDNNVDAWKFALTILIECKFMKWSLTLIRYFPLEKISRIFIDMFSMCPYYSTHSHTHNMQISNLFSLLIACRKCKRESYVDFVMRSNDNKCALCFDDMNGWLPIHLAITIMCETAEQNTSTKRKKMCCVTKIKDSRKSTYTYTHRLHKYLLN